MEVIRRLREEFGPPGLSLTRAQARRLCGADASTSAVALRILVSTGFLRAEADRRPMLRYRQRTEWHARQAVPKAKATSTAWFGSRVRNEKDSAIDGSSGSGLDRSRSSGAWIRERLDRARRTSTLDEERRELGALTGVSTGDVEALQARGFRPETIALIAPSLSLFSSRGPRDTSAM